MLFGASGDVKALDEDLTLTDSFGVRDRDVGKGSQSYVRCPVLTLDTLTGPDLTL